MVYLTLLSSLPEFSPMQACGVKMEYKGIDNTIGFVSSFVAGISLSIVWWLWKDRMIPVISVTYLVVLISMILVNTTAVWAGIKALKFGGFAGMMPFLAITAIGTIPAEYLLRDLLPTVLQFWGVLLIVVGSILTGLKADVVKEMQTALACLRAESPLKPPLFRKGIVLQHVIMSSLRSQIAGENKRTIQFFTITIICYSVSPALMSKLVIESHAPLFSAVLLHLGMAIAFLLMMLAVKEGAARETIRQSGKWGFVLMLIIISGLANGLIENGPSFVALAQGASANEVFSVKRIGLFLTLLTGWIIFKEPLSKKHVLGSTLMITGAMAVIYFKPQLYI